MERQTNERIQIEDIEAVKLPVYTGVYTLLGVDPTKPGAAIEIRDRSLKLIPYLKAHPHFAKAIGLAGLAAGRYARLESVFAESA